MTASPPWMPSSTWTQADNPEDYVIANIEDLKGLRDEHNSHGRSRRRACDRRRRQYIDAPAFDRETSSRVGRSRGHVETVAEVTAVGDGQTVKLDVHADPAPLELSNVKVGTISAHFPENSKKEVVATDDEGKATYTVRRGVYVKNRGSAQSGWTTKRCGWLRLNSSPWAGQRHQL